MAVIKFQDGTQEVVKPQLAETIWLILSGEKEPANDKQAAFVESVADVYLNWHNPTTPKSYLIAKKEFLK